MKTSRTDELLAILQEHFNPREEGWLWLAMFRDGDEKGLLNQIEGAYEDPVLTARALARIINECGVQSYLALCRWDGRPTEADREMWRYLRRQISPDLLLDLVAFNDKAAWSMRDEDTAAA